MKKYSYMSDEDKLFIINNYDSKSLGRIGQILKKSRQSVYTFHKKWLRTKRIGNLSKKGNGRPRVLNKYHLKRIEKFLKVNPQTTLRDIKSQVNLSCHISTLSGYLKTLGIRRFKMVRKPKLLPRHEKERVTFAKRHRRWSDKWHKVIFSDESSIEYGKFYQKYVYRHKGESLKEGHYEPRKTQFGKIYVKIWGAISSEGTLPLVFIEDKWNRFTYRKILEDNLIEPGKNLIGNDFIFQQGIYFLPLDGDTVHTSRFVTKWLSQNHIKTIGWPVCSCDLNPIENLWGWLKVRLAKKIYKNLDEFKNSIREVWGEVTPELCKSLIGSMPRRIESVIDRNGKITKY